MWLPDPASMAVTALWIVMLSIGLSLVTTLLGLYSLVTGEDHWPRVIRPLRRRVPATPDDRRTNAVTMVLRGTGVMLLSLAVAMNALALLDPALDEPGKTFQFLLGLLAVVTGLASIGGAHLLGLGVRYRVGSGSAAEQSGLPLNPRDVP
jgi:hypothetical protein